MYSGMAVRTAVAIGLASGMSSLPVNMRKEGKRTWWYVLEDEFWAIADRTRIGAYIRMRCRPFSSKYYLNTVANRNREMCCSSGRLDSMKEHHYYQVPLPTLKVTDISIHTHGNNINTV